MEEAVTALRAMGFDPKLKAATKSAISEPAIAGAVAEPEARTLQPREFDHGFAGEYLALAKELGVNAEGLTDDAVVIPLEETIAGMGLRVYDNGQVKAYLTSRYGAERPATQTLDRRAMWAWRPLRAADSTHQDSGRMAREMGWTFVIGGIAENGSLVPWLRPYSKAVPLPVLLTVRDIVTKHPEAKFYVSDEVSEQEAAPIRDPFLLVQLKNKTFIVERWDEPNYRER